MGDLTIWETIIIAIVEGLTEFLPVSSTGHMIITQKWIAMFPEGCEAWAEQRRTGYPRLFPVRYNHSQNGCIDTEIMVRRLNFPGTLQTEDPDQYLALVETLGDPDDGGTRLWWDVESNGLD